MQCSNTASDHHMRAGSQNFRKIFSSQFFARRRQTWFRSRARLLPPLRNRRPPRFRILHGPGRLERDGGSSVGAAHVEAVHLDVNDDKLGVGSSCCTRKCVARAANVASSSAAHDSAHNNHSLNQGLGLGFQFSSLRQLHTLMY